MKICNITATASGERDSELRSLIANLTITNKIDLVMLLI